MARRDAVNDAPIRPHRVTKESSMPQIGEFTRTKNGYAGRIRTLSLDVEIALIPAEHTDAENAPDYRVHHGNDDGPEIRSEEHTSELQSLMRISYAVFCLKKKKKTMHQLNTRN